MKTTINTERFIRRVEHESQLFPARFLDDDVSDKINKSIVDFARTIENGTKARDIPRLVRESDLFPIDQWVREITANFSSVKKPVLAESIYRQILHKYTIALKAQGVMGSAGHNCSFE